MLSSMLRYGVALPVLVSAAVLLISWPLWRRTKLPQKGAWAVALALGLGCAAGQIGVEGARSFPPREAADRLFYLTLAAVALDVLDFQRFCPSWLRGALRAVLWLVVVWSLLPPALRTEASRGVPASWLVGLGLAGLVFWFALALTARRLPGTTMLLLFLVSAGTIGVLSRGHSVTLTQLAGVLTAALLPILIRSACGPPVILATAPVMVLLPGLWLRSHFYDYEPPPMPAFLLLAAATVTGTLGLLPGIRSLAPWRRCLLCAAAASLLATAAVLLARDASAVEKPEELLQMDSEKSIANSGRLLLAIRLDS
ncbi:MAG TPA: hypothetical protein VH643_34255 [Gemmataceae bacterium]